MKEYLYMWLRSWLINNLNLNDLIRAILYNVFRLKVGQQVDEIQETQFNCHQQIYIYISSCKGWPVEGAWSVYWSFWTFCWPLWDWQWLVMGFTCLLNTKEQTIRVQFHPWVVMRASFSLVGPCLWLCL